MRSGRNRTETDSQGAARLVVAPGPCTLMVSRLGFRSDTLQLAVRAGMDTTLEAVLVEQTVEIAPVVVTTTRTGRRMEDEPERVEVLAGEDVEEKSEMRPGNLTTLLSEMSGVRIQTASAATGAASLRIQGLRGQYTEVLADGLPLYGVDATGLGLLQTPPLGLEQAEVIKGAATALYGPSALGGVLNLISRRPAEGPGEQATLLNLTSRSGTDGTLWLSRRLDERWGYTLLGGAHRQALTDPDRDGWADLAEYTRGEIRPRLFWHGADGRSVLATVGAMAEDRSGGAADPPSGSLIRQDVDTRRGDTGLIGRFPLGSTGLMSIRSAASAEWQRHRSSDPSSGGVPYDDRRRTLFSEATYTRARGSSVWLLGAAFQQDAYRNADLVGFDYTFTTPSLFASGTVSPARWLSASASGRGDFHNRYGTIYSPRVSLLAHATHALEARLSAGTGFFAPTPFTEETQAIELARLKPPSGLKAEHARSASFDLTARTGAFEINGTLFTSVIDHPVVLRENSGDPARDVALAIAAGPTRTHGAELFAVYNHEPIMATVYYAYLRASELSPEAGFRREVPLAPRHSAGLDVAWEEDESGTRVGVELFYTGRQSLEHDPYRSTSAPYPTLGLLVSQKIRGALVFVNADNLTDVRQTRYEPIPLPAPGPGGRVAVDQWAPLEGRIINTGVRIGF